MVLSHGKYLWDFWDFKHYTSLKLLTAVMGVEHMPKDDVDGSMVAKNSEYRYCKIKAIANQPVARS
ncbi:hypothetical protein ACDQ55_08520 [Chitinophaga sp. 30R24]|uniref:hypothetical protein n=1 Tax=Chitinophaga sp. 30R24 TaxID=3248838 RepID=UPI003B920F9D